MKAYSACISQFNYRWRILRLGITVIQKMLVVFQRTFLGQILKRDRTFLGFVQVRLSLADSRLWLKVHWPSRGRGGLIKPSRIDSSVRAFVMKYIKVTSKTTCIIRKCRWSSCISVWDKLVVSLNSACLRSLLDLQISKRTFALPLHRFYSTLVLKGNSEWFAGVPWAPKFLANLGQTPLRW